MEPPIAFNSPFSLNIRPSSLVQFLFLIPLRIPGNVLSLMFTFQTSC